MGLELNFDGLQKQRRAFCKRLKICAAQKFFLGSMFQGYQRHSQFPCHENQ